jgi:hypothetical protein
MSDVLSTIDWPAVEEVYGADNNIPDLFQSVLSDNPEVYWEAWSDLYDRAMHQGTRHDGTVTFVAPVLALVAEPGLPNKPVLLRLLWRLIAGPASVGEGFHICDGEGFDGYRDQFEVSLQCYQAALTGLPVLLELAADPDAGQLHRPAAGDGRVAHRRGDSGAFWYPAPVSGLLR